MNNDCPARKIAQNNPSNNCAKLKLIPSPSLVLVALLLGVCRASLGQGDATLEAPGLAPLSTTLASGNVTLFQNVCIFDGKTAKLSPPSNVLVRDNKIERISLDPIAVDTNANVRVIPGNGRVLMPGLIDAHWHAFMAGTPQTLVMTADISYLHLLAARQAEATLMRGFTTVRDLGGPVFGLKRAIDEGVMIGPRIYPCGAMISQTSGHGDFRFPFEVPRTLGGPLSHSEVEGIAAIADSPDEVVAVDLGSKRERQFLHSRTMALWHAFFSWDDRWVVCKTASAWNQSQILIASVQGGLPGDELVQ